MSIDYAEIARLAKLGRRAEKRGKAIQGFVTALLTKVAADLMDGWFLMLAVGIAHAEWVRTLPPIGYWWAVLLVLLLRSVFSDMRPKPKGDSR